MAEVRAALVKELREKTGAPMMDCKRALAESEGDLEAAVDWLRKKGLSAAVKKAGRIAGEGLIGVATRGPLGALVEVNCETDFVARNASFQRFVQALSNLVLEGSEAIDELNAAAYPGAGHSVEAERVVLVSTIGENLVLRRTIRLAVDQGAVFSYVHGALGSGIGKIGVLVALRSSAPEPVLAELGKGLAMHVAAAAPIYLDIASVPPAALARERGVLAEQAQGSGKSGTILERMVEGRLRKFYEEMVLLEQVYVVDEETKISRLVEKAAQRAGAEIRVAGFARFALGEAPTPNAAAAVGAPAGE